MINKPIDEILKNKENKVIGVRSGQKTIKAPIIICDPSYAIDKVKKIGKIIRAICFVK